MKRVAGADAAKFAEESLTFFTPFHQIGCSAFFFGGAWEDKVGDFEIAFGADVGGGFGIDGLGHEERGLAHFETGAVIATDGGIDFSFVDDGGVVTDLWGELILIPVTAKEQGENDEGVFSGDETAARFHLTDFEFELVDHELEFAIARGTESFDRVLFLSFQ